MAEHAEERDYTTQYPLSPWASTLLFTSIRLVQRD